MRFVVINEKKNTQKNDYFNKYKKAFYLHSVCMIPALLL